MLLSNIKINFQNNTESHHSRISLPQSVQDLTQGLKAEEIFITESDYAIDVFFIAENRKKFKTEFLKQFAAKTSGSNENIEKYIENYESADAVRRFYQCAIGLKTSGEITQNLRSFRNSFDIARELKLVGPYLNKLYQRGVWLAEKIRI